MKKIIKPLLLLLLLLFVSSCDNTPPVNTEIKTPSNIEVIGTTLTWDFVPGVKYYEIKIITNNQDEVTTETSSAFDFSGYLNIHVETLSFYVKSLCKDTTFTSDSLYSDEIIFTNPNYVEDFDKDILSQSFLSASTAPEGWTYNYNASIYADDTLKFSASKQSITSPTFKAYTNFTVEATIIGKNAGGDATITFYGLNENGDVVEKVEIVGPIGNTTNTIEATFTNTKVTSIKFEYTTKATGNFGLSNIYIYHLDREDVISISTKNLTSTYIIGEEFDYKGSLVLEYPNNTFKEVLLNDIKNDITIKNFVNDKFYKGNLTITYLEKSVSVPYLTTYNYPSLASSASSIDVSIIDNLIFLEIADLDVIFNINANIDESLYNTYVEDNVLEYYFGDKSNISINVIENNYLTSTNDELFYLTPTTTLIYTSNGILIEAYGTTVLINTTNDIDEDILDSYDYLISTSAINIAKTKNLIINKETTISDYNALASIYETYPNTYIYDTTLNDTISFSINKYDSNFTTTTTEISSLDTWNYEYEHIEKEYEYNHEEYYESIKNLTGNALKNALKALVTSTHTNLVDYDYAKTAYATTEPDLDTPGNIILFYSGNSISSKWDNGITWNREHIWPKSLSGGLFTSVDGNDKNAGTDLHHIRPASSSINSSRKNKPYGEVTDNIYFEPRDEVKGDVARILFYMSIRYGLDIEELSVAKSIDMLIEWHNQDPVDYYEEYRNEQIQIIQGNYNPFIDNPWLVDLIF